MISFPSRRARGSFTLSLAPFKFFVEVGVRLAPSPLTDPDLRLSRASGAREFHPHALSEPYVNLSIHTAPIIQSFSETPPSVQRGEVVATQRHATISPQEQSDVSVICTLSRPTASNTCRGGP